MKKSLFSFFAFLVFASSVFAQKTQEEYERTHIKGLKNPDETFNFLVVGDWGRNGNYNQQQVADRMDETAHHLDIEFIVSVGDNFYTNGVASVDDPLWRTSFENIYKGANLFIDWYAVLGNHDYRGNPQAQIDYSKRSRRWNMPARYYSFEKTINEKSGEKMLVVFLDTSPFERKYYTDETYMPTEAVKQDTLKQKQWLEKTLAQSNARWKVVVGHHPLYTTGKRIDEVPYVRYSLEPILEKHKVDAYFAGHEHDLQHQKPQNVFTNHFLSGAGSEVRNVKKPKDYTLFAKSEHGFMAISVSTEEFLVQVISDEGEVIYKTTLKK